jgi:pantoate--beta-alanine ligase
MIKILKTPAEIQTLVREWRRQGIKVALVPTMGNLHEGHMALVRHAQTLGERVIVSIFVNPTQFNRPDDLANYPRTLDKDMEKLISVGCDAVFTPDAQTMYPTGGLATRVIVPGISDILEGEKRPGHFTGVATIVCKLFNLVQPDVALFGQKDFQQLMVIRQMAEDLNMPIEIIGLPTVRESDGLAMSSRNNYLTPEQRAIAPRLQQVLQSTLKRLNSGEYENYIELQQWAMDQLNQQGFKAEYIEIRRAIDLLPPNTEDTDLVLLASAWLGKARLIDNLPFQLH